MKVWTEKRTGSRSLLSTGDKIVDISVGNCEGGYELQADGSILITGDADLYFDGLVPGEVDILIQDLSLGEEINEDNLAVVELEVTEDPKSYIDSSGEYCYYQVEETVSEAFLNNMSLMGIRLVDNEQKPVSAGSPVATGQTLQEIRNGKVDDEVSIVVKGDLDCNGIVNIDDLMYLYQYVSGCVPEGTFTDAQLKAADYADHDGVIDDKDLAELLNYINERGYEPGTKAAASESQVGLNVRYLDSTGTREI